MPTITPISDLKNYGQVLDKVEEGRPVYLTKNGRGEYSIHKIEDEEIFEKANAMVRLLSELHAGFYSAFYRIRDGYIEVGRILYNRSDYIKKIMHFEQILKGFVRSPF